MQAARKNRAEALIRAKIRGVAFRVGLAGGPNK
jgi:hypothetical protein